MTGSIVTFKPQWGFNVPIRVLTIGSGTLSSFEVTGSWPSLQGMGSERIVVEIKNSGYLRYLIFDLRNFKPYDLGLGLLPLGAVEIVAGAFIKLQVTEGWLMELIIHRIVGGNGRSISINRSVLLGTIIGKLVE